MLALVMSLCMPRLSFQVLGKGARSLVWLRLDQKLVSFVVKFVDAVTGVAWSLLRGPGRV